MNNRMIRFLIGRILLVEAALLALPLAVAVLYHEPVKIFLIPMALLLCCGGLLAFRAPKSTAMFARDGLAIVALAWLAMSLFGALP
ncbi:MAG: TrkH family potassium uptake protein, partial [Oscillibacter sp.]